MSFSVVFFCLSIRPFVIKYAPYRLPIPFAYKICPLTIRETRFALYSL